MLLLVSMALQEHYLNYQLLLELKAKKILKEAVDEEVTSGKGPTGVAAAALYIAAVLEGEKRTQRDIADVVGVTEVTIRNRYKDLVEKLGIEDEVEKKVQEMEKKEEKKKPRVAAK